MTVLTDLAASITRKLEELRRKAVAHVAPNGKPDPGRARSRRRSRPGDYSDASPWTARKLARIAEKCPDLKAEVDAGRMTFTAAYRAMCLREAARKADGYGRLMTAWRKASPKDRGDFQRTVLGSRYPEDMSWRGTPDDDEARERGTEEPPKD